MRAWVRASLNATWLHLLVIAVVVVLAYVRLLHPDFHAAWDIITVHAFGLNYASSVFSDFGYMPFWDPFHFVGFPFYADPQPAVWYPVNLLMILAGKLTLQHVQMQLVLHYVIAGWTMYAFARYVFKRRMTALFLGVLYPLTGAFVVHASHLGMVNTAAWFPLLLLFGARAVREVRWSFVLASGLTLGVMILAGHFQTALFMLFAFVVWVCAFAVHERGWRSGAWMAVRQLVVVGAVAFVVSAIQVVPTYTFAQGTIRTNTNIDWALTESFVPNQLATILVPNFYGDVTADPYWGPNWGSQHYAYIGILPLLLVVLSFWRRKPFIQKFFIVFGVASLLLIIGRYTFVQPLLYLFVPLFDSIRAFANGLFLLHLSLAMLAGFGLDAVLTGVKFNAAWQRLSKWWVGVGVVSVLAFVGVMSMDVIAQHHWHDLRVAGLFQNIGSGIVLMLLFGVAGVLLLNRYFSGRVRAVTFGVLAVALLVIDLFSFTANHQHVAMPGSVHDRLQTPWGVQYLTDNQNDHWYRTHALKQDDILTPEYFYQTWGYNPLVTDRYAHLLRVADKNGGRWRDVMTALGVEYLVAETDLPTQKWETVEGIWHKNPEFRGRVWPVAEVTAIEAGAALDDVEAPMYSMDLSREAVVEGFASDAMFNTQVEIGEVTDNINTVAFTVNAESDAFLVMSDAMHDGWRLLIDGEEAPLYWTNLLLRGFNVPAGEHAIEMRFEPSEAAWAATLSGVGVLLILGLWSTVYAYERKRILKRRKS